MRKITVSINGISKSIAEELLVEKVIVVDEVEVHNGFYDNYLDEIVEGKYVVDTVKEDEAELAKTKADAITTTQMQLDTLTADYPKFEVDSFWIQELEARAYKLNALAPTPFIDKLCLARGITKDLMVVKIIANADSLKVATATLVGTYQASII